VDRTGLQGVECRGPGGLTGDCERRSGGQTERLARAALSTLSLSAPPAGRAHLRSLSLSILDSLLCETRSETGHDMHPCGIWTPAALWQVNPCRRQLPTSSASLLSLSSSTRAKRTRLLCIVNDTFRKFKKEESTTTRVRDLRVVIILQVRAKRKGQLDFPGRSLRSPFKFAVILTLVTSVRLSDRSAGLLASAEIITAMKENALRAGALGRAVEAVAVGASPVRQGRGACQ
jgi:hypothetical protein